MRFAYLRDPLFVVCVAAYFLNRLLLKRIWDDGFWHDHFNDLICIPFWVPILLWLQRQLGLRPDDAIPRASEIVIPLLIWSWVFEFYLPEANWIGPPHVSDYRDIVYYAAGAAMAAIFWRVWYQRPERQSAPAEVS